MNISELKLLEKIFSPTSLRQLGVLGWSKTVDESLFKSKLIRNEIDESKTLGEAYDAAFKILNSRGNRNEYVYKNILIRKILLGKHNLRTATATQEVQTGTSIADLVIYNGTASAYEIKSDRDGLGRLPQQIDDYRRAFSRVTVVADGRHLKKIETLVHPSVGLCELTGRSQISTIREATEDFSEIIPERVLELLRLDDYQYISKKLNYGEFYQLSEFQRKSFYQDLISLPINNLQSLCVESIKINRSLSKKENYLSQLPASLKNVMLFSRFNREQNQRIVKALDTSLTQWSRNVFSDFTEQKV